MRTVVPVPRGDSYPFWAARFSLLRDSLEVLPRRLDGTTAGCSFILHPLRVPPPITRVIALNARSGPSRVRRRLLQTCLGDPIPLAFCCYQVTEIYSSRYGFAIASSAWGPCNFGPFTDLAISVFREMSINTVLTPNPHVSL